MKVYLRINRIKILNMHTKNFIEVSIYSTYPYTATIAISSIALMEDKGNNGTEITLKEKRPDGSQIFLKCNDRYVNLMVHINMQDSQK